jgi:hypothetical protein
MLVSMNIFSNFLIMHFSVDKKKFPLKRNFEEEKEERQSAERACIEALAEWESSCKQEGKVLFLEF